MAVFISDQHVAQALAGDVAWQETTAPDCDLDGFGCLTSGQGRVAGVMAETDHAAVAAYFSLFNGEWRKVETDHGGAFGYFSDDPKQDFTPFTRHVETRVAQDVVRVLAAPSDVNQPINRTGLLMRARSFVRARDENVASKLRAGFVREDVAVSERSLPYARYFDVEDITLRHRKFAGGMSEPIVRSVLRSADAVTVLPYDPVLDQVVLVEQFRAGAFVRGDNKPWVLEPVAGRCDGDEPVEIVAEREMEEEAGLTLLSLESVGNFYPSPGCLSEYLYSFVGIVDLSSAKTGVYGLESENEDIRTHFLAFDDAMALISSGEADNGPLLLSLYWLAANRARLRDGASTA